jgi:hypothetical protein
LGFAPFISFIIVVSASGIRDFVAVLRVYADLMLCLSSNPSGSRVGSVIEEF